jgi:hypothetical protein
MTLEPDLVFVFTGLYSIDLSLDLDGSLLDGAQIAIVLARAQTVLEADCIPAAPGHSRCRRCCS